MLDVYKPPIQYATEEAVRVVIDMLVFVTERHKRAIEVNFDRNPELEVAQSPGARTIRPTWFANILSEGAGVTEDIVRAFDATSKSQLSMLRGEGEDISKYGAFGLGGNPDSVLGQMEKPNFEDAPSDLASIGRYVLTPDNLNYSVVNVWVKARRFNWRMK